MTDRDNAIPLDDPDGRVDWTVYDFTHRKDVIHNVLARYTGTAGDPEGRDVSLRRLAGVAELRAALDAVEHSVARTARDHGATFQELADAAGLSTRGGAKARYSYESVVERRAALAERQASAERRRRAAATDHDSSEV